MSNGKQELNDAAIAQILENVDESKLSEWEKEFVKSVRTYWGKNKKLSDKQKKRLRELWEKTHAPKESK